MGSGQDSQKSIQEEIWTRSYLRSIVNESPRVAAAIADGAVVLFESRWRSGPASDKEIRRANSVIAAGIVSGMRLKELTGL